MRLALQQVAADRHALAAGVAATLLATVLFAASGQMVVAGPGGPTTLVTPGKIAIFLVFALMVGLQAGLQVYALRLRLERRGHGAGLGGIVLALVGATCCTPLVWPALLSLFGVSGVTLLGVNAALHRWFWLFVSLAAAAMAGGVWQAVRAIAAPCTLPAADEGVRRGGPG